MEMKLAWHSFAMLHGQLGRGHATYAFANMVFPVPGGP
jgi:hypothetical protein